MARPLRGQPGRQRTPVGPPAGAGVDRNYFGSVVDELRKVVWPTWDELGRMTGVVVTTVILMALIVSAADFALGKVVQQLYNTPGSTSSQVAPKGSTVKPGATATPTIRTASPTTAAGSTAPVTP